MSSSDLPEIIRAIANQLDQADIGIPLPPINYKHSAVLALLINNTDQPEPNLDQISVLFTQRPDTLRKHPNQICLPGGKLEPGDTSLLNTALREAQEEIGFEESRAKILGRLSSQYTPTRYVITPFVAYVERPWSPEAVDQTEVSDVIVPTLATLMNPDTHSTRGEFIFDDRRYADHQFAISKAPLWGATARIIWDLLERCSKSSELEPIVLPD